MLGKIWLVCSNRRNDNEMREVFDTKEKAMAMKKHNEKYGYIVLVFECRELDSNGE